MTNNIDGEKFIDKLSQMVPELTSMRDRIDEILCNIHMFTEAVVLSPDRTKVNVITKEVCSYFETNLIEIRAKRKMGNKAEVRHILSTMISRMTELSKKDIGEYTHRDGSTVSHSVRVISEAEETGDVLWDYYTLIQERVCKSLNILL